MNGDQRIQNRKERKCNTRSEMVTWAETDPPETDWWSWTWKCYSLNWGTPSVTHLNLISSKVTGHFHMFSWLWITSLRIIYSSSQFTVVFFLLPGALSPSLLEVEGCEIVQETSIMPSSPPRLPSTSPPPPQPAPPAGSLAVISLSASSVGWIPASSWGKRARLIECHNISSPGSSVF